MLEKKSLPWERGKQKGDNYIDFTCLVDGRCHWGYGDVSSQFFIMFLYV